jgi:hypothetical protein
MSLSIFTLIFIFCLSFLMILGVFSIAGLDALLKPKWIEPFRFILKKLTWVMFPLWLSFALVILFHNSVFPFFTQSTHARGAQAAIYAFRDFYLKFPFFLGRGIFYLIVATIFSRMIYKSLHIYGALSLVLLLFLGSLASYDWMMSLAVDFHSTIYGLLIIVTGTLIVNAICLIRMQKNIDPKLLNDINNVHLAIISIWSYLVFMQYLTVWSGNLPGESAYFKDRFHGLFGTLAGLILIGQTLISIPLLLFKKLKRNINFSRGLAVWTLCWQLLHLFWMTWGRT